MAVADAILEYVGVKNEQREKNRFDSYCCYNLAFSDNYIAFAYGLSRGGVETMNDLIIKMKKHQDECPHERLTKSYLVQNEEIKEEYLFCEAYVKEKIREIFADLEKKLDKEGFLNGYDLIETKKKWGVDE